LVMYPVRWLPAAWQVIGLNLFSAICSVLTLALLARSVAILPHDRTRDQRQLERNEFSLLGIPGSWLPPLFAVLVCGFQLTFWEHATVSTYEALDLLIFAYVVRCVLEYRLDRRDSWLYRTAFLLGLSITSNYAMIGFLPVLIISLVWIRGRSFFKWRFLATMTLLGLGGLTLYLLLPAINGASGMTDQGFFEMLKLNLWYQKSQLLGVPRYIVLLVGLTSLFPVLFIGIKWPNSLGDISALGNALTNLMTHIIHAVFLAACLYVAFDPPFSPRKMAFGQAMLPFYYLGALSIGYFAGYFMLVFGHAPFKPWQRHRQLRGAFNKAVVGLVWLAAIGVPAGLVIKNLPEVQKSSGPYLARMAEVTVQSLPEGGGVLLSDDLYRLYTVYEALSRKGTLDSFILIDTASMHNAAYQRHLRKKYGERWPATLAERPLKTPVDVGSLVSAILNFSTRQRLFYLQPSFGYYFEYFYLEPLNLVYELKRYPVGAATAPVLTEEKLASNDRFWKQFIASELPALRQPSRLDKPKKGQKQADDINLMTALVSRMYSRGLTWIGVEAQKAGQVDKARDYFKAALELNPDNASAFISLDYNNALRDGKKEMIKPSEGAIKRVSAYGGNWHQIMAANGPVDDPNALYLVAQTFARAKHFRQSAQYLSRMAELLPSMIEARIALSGMLVQAGFPALGLELIEKIRSEPKKAPLDQSMELALVQNEAWAHVFKDDLETAEKILHAAEKKYPGDDTPFSTLTEIYFRIGRTERAVTLFDSELKRNPDNIGALVNYAAIKIQSKDYEAAIPMLDRALKVAGDNEYALINRAIANLHTGRLDEARRDYELIRSRNTKAPPAVHYGLAEVAWRKKQPKAALKHYEDYAKLAPTDTTEFQEVQKRIKQLKSGSI
jgi:tetratricopeptide (TPR) repeat protein